MNYQQEMQNQKASSEPQYQYMNLKKMPGYMVLDNLERYVKSERKLMHIILAHVYEVHSRRLYFERGFTSTYEYLRSLGYSESPAYERIRSAELLGKIPEVTEKLKAGSVNLTQLNQVQRVVRQKKDSGEYVTLEQTASLIQKIENKSTFETKKVLAQELNLPILEETKIKPQSDNSVRVEMTFSEEDYKEIEKAKMHMSHVVPGGEIEKIFLELVKKYNQKIEGKSKSSDETEKHAVEVKESANAFDLSRDRECITQHLLLAAESTGTKNGVNFRKAIPVKLRRKIFAKAGYACEFVSSATGKRCNSKYQLAVDHIQPVWAGGTNAEENLRCVCGAHNRKVYRSQAGYVH